VAAIGLAAGSGFFVGAIAATVLVYLTLSVLGGIERVLAPTAFPTLTVVAKDEPGQLGRVGSFLGRKGISIRNICLEDRDPDDALVHISMELKLPTHLSIAEVISDLMSVSGILRVEEGT
jgi:putative Mg2+ transporter-C (MgtC) family protein